jgi:hypothetical protein
MPGKLRHQSIFEVIRFPDAMTPIALQMIPSVFRTGLHPIGTSVVASVLRNFGPLFEQRFEPLLL